MPTPIESIQKVFGAEWKPSAAFTPELQARGIYGAVRVPTATDPGKVYTIGPGGEAIATPERYQELFGTLEQKGIVGEVSPEQARALGIMGPTPTEPLVEPETTADLDVGEGVFIPPTPEAPSITDQYTQSMLATLERQRLTLEQRYQTELTATQTKLEAAQKRQEEFLATQKGVLEEEVKPLLEPFRADIEKTERERLKVEENFFANQQLTNELETLLTTIQADLQREKDITGLTAIRQPRIEKATEEATARVGVIEATMAARNNQITVANNLIDRTVTAMTADRNDQLTYYNALLSFYDKQIDLEGAKIITLSEQEQNWIKAEIGLLEGDLASTQANVDYIKGLMLDPNTAWIMAQSGVTLNDTPAEVQQKLADHSYRQEAVETRNQMEAQGYSYVTPEVAATKPEGTIATITDSKGVVRNYYSPTAALDIASKKKELAKPYYKPEEEEEATSYSDEEFRNQARKLIRIGIPFEDAVRSLYEDPLIANAERGELILREIYGVEVPEELKEVPSYTPEAEVVAEKPEELLKPTFEITPISEREPLVPFETKLTEQWWE